MLEYVPARFKVIRHVRPKLACGCCERIVQVPAPSRPIDRGIAGPGAAGARAGLEVRRSPAAVPPGAGSTPERASSWIARRWPTGWARRRGCSIRWSTRSAATCWRPRSCTPTTRRCRCCSPGAARPRPGGCGPTCATTGRPAAPTPPGGVVPLLAGSQGRCGPSNTWAGFAGILQADGYAGFDQLYETGRIAEAACWAHVRRKFYDLHKAHGLADRRRGARADRRAVRDRGRDPRQAAR